MRPLCPRLASRDHIYIHNFNLRNSWKNGNNIFPRSGIEPGPLDSKSYTLSRRYKSRLVPQGSTSVSYTYTHDIHPLQLEIRPWISRSLRITWNETQGVLCTRGLFTVGAKCNSWKNGNNILPDWGSNPVRTIQSLTFYRVAIKAGLYRKAVQVCYIPIPGDSHMNH